MIYGALVITPRYILITKRAKNLSQHRRCAVSFNRESTGLVASNAIRRLSGNMISAFFEALILGNHEGALALPRCPRRWRFSASIWPYGLKWLSSWSAISESFLNSGFD